MVQNKTSSFPQNERVLPWYRWKVTHLAFNNYYPQSSTTTFCWLANRTNCICFHLFEYKECWFSQKKQFTLFYFLLVSRTSSFIVCLTEFILIWNGQAETSLNVEQWLTRCDCEIKKLCISVFSCFILQIKSEFLWYLLKSDANPNLYTKLTFTFSLNILSWSSTFLQQSSNITTILKIHKI